MRPSLAVDEVEAGRLVDALPLAQRLHDLVDLTLLVLQAFARVDVGDVDDGLQRRVEHLGHGIDVAAGVEEVADVQRLQPAVAVELLVVGVGDGLELAFVGRPQHRLAVAAEVGARHRHQVHLVAGDEGAQLAAQLVVRVGGDVVELVDGDQAVVEGLDAQFLDREAEGRVGADQHLVVARQELPDRLDLGLGDARLVDAWRVAQVPLRRDRPVPVEAVLGQGFIGEAAADRSLRHHDDGLLQALVVQLVQRNEHQRPALARCRRRLDEQVLLAALGVGTLLHRAHAQLVGLGRSAGACRGDGHRRHGVGVDRVGHDSSSAAAEPPLRNWVESWQWCKHPLHEFVAHEAAFLAALLAVAALGCSAVPDFATVLV